MSGSPTMVVIPKFSKITKCKFNNLQVEMIYSNRSFKELYGIKNRFINPLIGGTTVLFKTTITSNC